MHKTFFKPRDIDIQSFTALCSQSTEPAAYPCAADVVENIVIYDGDIVRAALVGSDTEAVLKAEMVHCLKDGPGLFVVRRAYGDLSVIDKSTRVFQVMVTQEKASGQGRWRWIP